MGLGDRLLVKPGTILLIIMIAGIGIALFTWAAEGIRSSSKKSLEQQDAAITCSTLDLDFVDRKHNETHYTVFVQSSQSADAVLVHFRSQSRNVSAIIEDPRAGEVRSVSVPLENVTDVFAYVKGCNRKFR
ncbi:MAG: hypothetical protein ABEI58_00610 [Candidatus Nanohaloarchaea archaeon]